VRLEEVLHGLFRKDDVLSHSVGPRCVAPEHICSAEVLGDQERPDPRHVRVMTYNVRYFGHPTRGLASTRGGIVRIARAIAQLSPTPHVVCLQEVETTSLRSNILRRAHPEETQLDRLLHELEVALSATHKPERYRGYYYPAHAYRLTDRTSVYTTGLAVLARSDVHVLHDNSGGPRAITAKSSVMGRLKQSRICGHLVLRTDAGAEIDVSNTHLSLPNFLSKRFWTEPNRMGFGDNQLAEAKALADFVHAERRAEHFIVAGDFNSLPGSPVDRYLREERGMSDGLQATLGVPASEARAYPTAGFMNLRMHLDHLYASPSLEWVDTADTRPFGQPGPFHGLSDHVPILAHVRPR
jgi:endonuclease/exonuclease/phosphatase family metal-dependent hydrolase